MFYLMLKLIVIVYYGDYNETHTNRKCYEIFLENIKNQIMQPLPMFIYVLPLL